MNPNYTEFKFPQIKAHPWSKVFSKRLPPDAVDLVSATLSSRAEYVRAVSANMEHMTGQLDP